jgi:hypothetical protein
MTTAIPMLPSSPSLQTFIPKICLVLGKLAEAAQKRLTVACLEVSHNLNENQPTASLLTHKESQHIQKAYQIWLKRYQQMEGESQNPDSVIETHRQRAFAEQTSYVFFVRLLLIRVLTDKGVILPPVKDEGCQRWFEFSQMSELTKRAEIRSETLLSSIYECVTSFDQHFFQQPVFDWFQPDNALVTLVSSQLNQYNFQDLSNDLLGFTYEALIERVARNQKGLFLTPPDIVEFMLNRAGYTSTAIIGENVLDLSCGSGSFLVHAARRLRKAIQIAMANTSPLERARKFIEQVQTKLVGLEINPFSCYLAELNLFIQILDDLMLLWNNGEQPNIERFAIYNTNSLEMPEKVLETTYKAINAVAPDEEASTLDEATLIKARRQTFTYILCNPPYINRGIIRSAKSYSKYPFYRDVVKGDENFYLLFLRLATYYIAPRGTMCFICPLNLLGDESTMHAREMFNRTDYWRLRSITRFYTRTVLFAGVLQGVCVIRIDQQPTQLADSIEIRGGFSLEEAEQSNISVPYARIISNYPARSIWSKPWLVNANPIVYDLWEFIQQNTCQNLSDLIGGKLHTAKGDVRSTWAKPMKTTASGTKTVPMTKGKKIVDWGDWSVETYLDHSITLSPQAKYYKNSLWVQKNIQRITSLTQTETVLLLKEVSGLEAKRPIRGTIIQRSASQPVVADETLVVMSTLDSTHENLAFATFGLLTSSLYNFLFSLFSTNAHANLTGFLRLPIPIWSTELEQRLAASTRDLLDAYKTLYKHKALFDINRNQLEQREREQYIRHIIQQQQKLDEQIIQAYDLHNPQWKSLISEGVPWAKGENYIRVSGISALA